MKLSLITLALVFAGCVSHESPTHVHVPTPVESAAAIQDKTVALVADTEDGVSAFCSGVWVDSNMILTANHCVEAEKLVQYMGTDDFHDVTLPVHVRQAAVYARDLEHDMATLLTGDWPAHGWAHVTKSRVVPGQAVSQVGHPLGLLWSYARGYVSAVRFANMDGDQPSWWVQASVPTSPGNSGDGLFNDDMELVGLCHSAARIGQNLNMFVHPKYIEDFLQRQGIE